MVSPAYIRPLLALIVVAGLMGIAIAVFRSGSHEPVPASTVSQQLPKNIDVALKKALFSEIKEGTVVWELAAERADYDKSGSIAYLSDVRMDFKHTASQGSIVVTADSGEYSSDTKDVYLKGNVHLVTEEGADFRTTSIKYRGATSVFSTNEPISFKQERLQLTAVGMDLGANSQRARFHSSVNSVLNTESGVRK